jgi:hypothetical protein
VNTTQIAALEEMQAAAWLAIRGSEEWAASYQADPKSLKALIKLENRLMQRLKEYFAELPNRVVNTYINWPEYQTQVIKAYDITVDISETEYQQEQAILFRLLFNDIPMMVALGSQSAATLYEITQPFTPVDLLVQKAAASLTTQLAETITAHTKQQIIDSIKVSLKSGESITDATARMDKIIGDPRRAERIARTESVRSFSTGIITYGLSTGASTKTWQTVNNPCDLCISVVRLNENATVGIADSFKSLVGPLFGNPAHPNCRCGVKINRPVDEPVDWNGKPTAPAAAGTNVDDLATMLENFKWY